MSLSLARLSELHAQLRAYLKKYYSEQNWDGIAIEAYMTGDIICVIDTKGVKSMFGQKAFLNFIFNNQIEN